MDIDAPVITMFAMMLGAPFISPVSIVIAGLIGVIKAGWTGRLLGAVVMVALNAWPWMAHGPGTFQMPGGFSPSKVFWAVSVVVALAAMLHAYLGQLLGARIRKALPNEGAGS